MNLDVQISANASRSEVTGWLGDRLKIKVKAPAVEGKANEELLRFLAEKLGIRGNQLRIIRGETANKKLIRIEGLDEDAVLDRLGAGGQEAREER